MTFASATFDPATRLGLVCPSTNTTLEPELWRMLPAGVSLHVARAFQDGPQAPELYRQIAANVAGASRDLASAAVEAIAFGCTSCTYFVPAAELRATMTAATGRPALCTADAVLAALRHLGVARLALVTPRTDFVNAREQAWLEARGFEVVAVRGMQLGASGEERASIGRVPPQRTFALARDADDAAADAVFLSCTNLVTLPVVAPLEAQLAKPVVTSNQATLWALLAAAAVATPVTGAGRLLAAPRPAWTLPADA